MNIEKLFSGMERLRVVDDEAPIHDEVVMQAVGLFLPIVKYAIHQRWLPSFDVDDLGWIGDVWFPVAEFPIPWAENREGWIDLAVLNEKKEPVLFLEIKSKRETQSASGWFRQIKMYEKTGIPCVLVVAHDLGEIQTRYLEWAKAKVIDLRKL